MSDQVSDTPLTDAMFTAWNWRDVSKCDAENPADFTRKLERSIDELNQRIIDRTSAFMADKAKDVARINMLEADNARLAQCAQDAYAKSHGDGARQSQAVGVEWQPIDTAPKDGAVILILSECGVHQGSHWNESIWHSHRGGGCCFAMYHAAHWMPLPPTHNDSGKEGGE